MQYCRPSSHFHAVIPPLWTIIKSRPSKCLNRRGVGDRDGMEEGRKLVFGEYEGGSDGGFNVGLDEGRDEGFRERTVGNVEGLWVGLG